MPCKIACGKLGFTRRKKKKDKKMNERKKLKEKNEGKISVRNNKKWKKGNIFTMKKNGVR